MEGLWEQRREHSRGRKTRSGPKQALEELSPSHHPEVTAKAWFV